MLKERRLAKACTNLCRACLRHRLLALRLVLEEGLLGLIEAARLGGRKALLQLLQPDHLLIVIIHKHNQSKI